jgi:hypothetical protein
LLKVALNTINKINQNWWEFVQGKQSMHWISFFQTQ